MGFQQAPASVATVNGDAITTVLFQQRVRFARWTAAQQLLQIMQDYGGEKALTDPNSPFHAQYRALIDAPAFARQVLDGLIVLKLVQREASARGLTVTLAETQAQIYAFFGFTPDTQPAPNPTEQAAQMQNFEVNRDNYFGQAGNAARMSQAEVIDTFTEQTLQIKVFQALTKDVPTQAEQIKVRHILVESQEKANALLAQIRGGANFAEVATANSLDRVSAPQGGSLEWSPRGVNLPEFENAIWNAKPGDLLGPIQTQMGFHLILIEGREVRPLSEGDLARVRDAAYRQWLQQARDKAAIKIVDNWQALIPAEPTLKDLGLPEAK